MVSRLDQSRVKAEWIIREKLKDKPLCVDEITQLLREHKIPSSYSVGKDIAWMLVEEGKAYFNDDWYLEQRKMTTPTNGQGIIRITLDGTHEDIDRILDAIQSGELKEIAGYPVRSIEIPGMPTIETMEFDVVTLVEGDQNERNA